MAYLSPGVYVEEVPSAVQAIAGVGTNTVGFIGYIPDEIEIPVPLSDDEMREAIKAKLNEFKAATADKTKTQKDVEEFEKTRADLENKLAQREKELNEKEEKLLAGDPEEAKKQRSAVDRDKLQLQKEQGDFAKKTREIEAAKKSLAGSDVQDVIAALKESIVPYKLEKHSIALTAPECDAKFCSSFSEYVSKFGNFSADDPNKLPGEAKYPGHRALTNAVYGFFKNGGTRCFVSRVNANSKDKVNLGQVRKALADFESIDAIAIVAAPGLYGEPHWTALVEHCETCKDRFAILDCHPDVNEAEDSDGELDINLLTYGTEGPSRFLPSRSKNAAFYFPYIEVIDPAKQMQDLDLARNESLRRRGKVYVTPSGHIAGIFARVDSERGVHAAPANRAILGAVDLKYYIGKGKQDLLNPQGVNCIRNMNGNIVVYGARTIGGDLNGEWKYVNVRRTFLFIAESIDEGTQWVVFEPNDRALWGKIRRNVSAFLTNVWRSGALFGSTPEEAFYVKCDDELNPPEVREVGQVITEIGIAIVRPAEFVIFRITQSTGQKSG